VTHGNVLPEEKAASVICSKKKRNLSRGGERGGKIRPSRPKRGKGIFDCIKPLQGKREHELSGGGRSANFFGKKKRA